MRMLKVRKKSISLIVVLAFIMTLFPMALPAFAADYKTVGAVESVDADGVFALNRVRGEFSKGELQPGDSVIIRLPRNFEFCKKLVDNVNDREAMSEADWNAGEYANCITLEDEDGDSIPFEIVKLSDYEIKLVIPEGATVPTNQDITMFINLGAVYVDDGFDGEIELTFDAARGGFSEGTVVVGRVTGGEVTVIVEDDSSFGDTGGEVVLRIREDRAGALDKDPESVKIILPKGFEWERDIHNATVGGENDKVWLVDGVLSEVENWKVVIDEDELILSVDRETRERAAYIEIIAWINVEDETRANYGDIEARVTGESDVGPSTIVVGNYGDYEVEVSAADPKTVYAGRLEQEIADITLKEAIADSLVDGRSVTLTLPEWAKWGALDKSYSDGSKAALRDLTFPGRDGRVAKYIVDGGTDSRATIKLEDMEVVLSPDAPEGDLEVEISGSAGVSGTVVVAEVKKPLDVEVTSSPVIGIGKAEQAIAEITITEAKAEMLVEGKYLVIELPKDVDWDEYDVEVTEGDLELGKVTMDDHYLIIKIDRDSTEPSTITINGAVTAYRTVPEGRVIAEIKGDAIIEVNDLEAIKEYYDVVVGENIVIGDAVAIEEKEWDEGLFEDDEYIEAVEVAFVGTPAPGEQKITAVFKLGSTDWTLNGEPQTMDVAPYAKDGRTYLPMRYVAKALGIPDTGILWKAGKATFISADRVVAVTIGSNVMTINGAPVPIDAAPEIVNGRTMLPIRWVATAFGITVDWNAETQEVTIN